MKTRATFAAIFLLFIAGMGADDVFGDKLATPAKVQVVNSLPDRDSLFSGPYIKVFGISSKKDEVISENIEREKSVTVTSGYSRLFCVTDKCLYVLPLQAGQEYIARVEADKVTLINMSGGAMQTIQQKNYW
ncbi:MAG: hypothetical protein LBU85_08955 [Treponema sp.]|jgi:hypothetical protein|nr:hypothetical protein [Treponema sp.]